MIIQAISVLTILFIGLIPAYADSPLAQYNSGVPISSIQCSDEKILIQSTSGKPYCMSESTAVKLVDRGFSLVLEEISQVELSETVWSSKDFPAIEYSSRQGSGSSSTYHPNSKIPPFILEFPNQARIGEEFVVNVEYTITPDHLDVYPNIPNPKLVANYPKQIEIISTEYIIKNTDRSPPDWYGQYTRYTIMEFPNNELGSHEVDIVFKMTEPLPYEDHTFGFGKHHEGEIVGRNWMHISSTDDVLTISPHQLVSGYDENKYPNRYEEPRSFGWIPPWTPGVGPVYSDFNSLSLEDKSYIESWFKNRYNMTAPQSNDDNWTSEVQAEYETWLKSTNQTR